MENNCPNLDCPIHYRVDGEAPGLTGGTSFMSYVGNYFILTDEPVRSDISENEAFKEAVAILMIRLSGGDDDTVDKRMDDLLEGATTVYYVGPDGVFNDVPSGVEPVETFTGHRQDNRNRHEMTVGMYRLSQGLETI